MYMKEAIQMPECISLKKYRNDYDKLLINVIYTSCWVNEQMKNFLCPECITQQQYNILRILRESGKPLSILQIRNLMLDKMSDASRIVDRMVAKDLVRKCVCANDRRLVDISLTGEGEELLQNIDRRIHDMDNILHVLTAEEVTQLNHLLNKMRNGA